MTWQAKLARFGKQHPKAKPFVFLALWLGYHLAGFAEALRYDKRQPTKRHRPALRVAALVLALFMLVGQLPILITYANEDLQSNTSDTSDTSDIIIPEAGSSTDSDSSKSITPAEGDSSISAPASSSTTSGADDSSSEPAESSSDNTSSSDSTTSDDSDMDISDTSNEASDTDSSGEPADSTNPVITAFAPFASDLQLQYPVGLPTEMMNLPASVTATVQLPLPTQEDAGNSNADAADSHSESSAQWAEESRELTITWQPEEAYDALIAGTYTFTAQLPDGYLLAEGLLLPSLSITLMEVSIRPLAATIVYVDAGYGGGNGAPNGSLTRPYTSIAAALSGTSGEVDILLMSDVPSEPISITGRSISIASYGNPSPSYIISRAATAQGLVHLFTLSSSATLTLSNITLDGASSTDVRALINVKTGCTLTLLDGAKLQNNRVGSTTAGGAVLLEGGSTFDMKGGTITGNRAATGSAVSITGNTTVFNMSGGSISNNVATGSGGAAGAVYIAQNTFNMSGGSISGNTATGDGGGVYLGHYNGIVTMTGGSITGNTATGKGADFYLYRGTLNLTKGTIGSNNGGYYTETQFSGTQKVYTALTANFSSNDTMIRVENAVGAVLASFGTYAGNAADKALAASRFQAVSDTTSKGEVSGNNILLSDPRPVKLVYGTTTRYCESLAEAFGYVSAGQSAIISLRRNLQGTEIPTGTLALPTMSGSNTITFQSEDFGGVTPSIYTLKQTFTGSLFPTLGTGHNVIFSNIHIDFNNQTGTAAGITVATGGRLQINSGAAIYGSSGPGISAGGGTLTIGGGTIRGNSGPGVQIGGGAVSMSSGAIHSNTNTGGNGGGVALTAGSFTMTGGSIYGNNAADGAGIYFGGGTLTLDVGIIGNASARNVASGNGGGLYLGATGFSIKSTVQVIGNTAANGGGIYYAPSTAFTFPNITLSSNGAANGGGLYVQSADATVSTGSITGNTASTNGAGIYLAAGSLSLGGSAAIRSNTAIDDGGGAYIASAAAGFTMTGGSIGSVNSGNRAANGGGVYLAGGTASISGGSIAYNQATNGGGLYTNGTAVLALSGTASLANNSATNGGGIYSGSSGALTLSGGSIGATGGANTATSGGGVYLAASAASGATLSGTTVIGNTAVQGAGIYLTGTATLTVSNTAIIDANTATGSGGGVYIDSSAGFTLAGGHIGGDTGNTAASGGGVYAAGSITVSGGTITGNTATSGGASGSGVYLQGQNLSFSGGYIGTSYEDNGLARSPSTCQVVLGAAISPTTASITLEKSPPYEADSFFTDWVNHGSSGAVPATVASCFWSINGEAEGLIGIYIGSNYVFSAVDILVEYYEDGTVSHSAYYNTLTAAFAAIGAMSGGTAQAPAKAVVILQANISSEAINLSGSHIDVTIQAAEAVPNASITRVGTGHLLQVNSTQALHLSGIVLDGASGSIGDAQGALVYVYGGSLTTTGATLQNNSNGASVPGGGLYIDGGSANIGTGTVISGNSTAHSSMGGGGILITEGSLTVAAGASVGGNHANGLTSSGGGLLATGSSTTVTLNGGTFSNGNSAGQYGGGIAVLGGATLGINGSSITANTAGTAGQDVYLGSGADFTLTQGTIGTVENDGSINGFAAYTDTLITIPTGFDASGTTVRVENIVHETPVASFTSGISEEDKQAAADCFSAVTGSDNTAMHGEVSLDGSKIIVAKARPVLLQQPSGNSWVLVRGFDTITDALSNVGSLTTVRLQVLEDMSTGLAAIPAGKHVTLAAPNGSGGAYTVTRAASGNLFTVANGATLALENVTLDGGSTGSFTDGGGSLVLVNGGALELPVGVRLQNNAHDGGATPVGADVHANGGNVMLAGATLADGSTCDMSLASSARLTLKNGSLAALSLQGSSGITIDPTFSASSTTIRLLGTYVKNTAMGFLTCPESLRATAAPCFIGRDADARPLLGGVTNGSLVWQGVSILLTVDGEETYHATLQDASDAAPTGQAATITVIDDIITTGMAVASGKSITLTAPHGTSANYTIARGAAGALFDISGSLTLQRVTLDGAKASWETPANLIQVQAGGSLELANGLLQNNNGSAVAVLAAGASFVMQGGKITGNTAANGGVAVQGGSFQLQGGSISVNSATNGGAIYVASSGTATVSGGSITGNTATAGGGIYSTGTLNLSDAVLEENMAGQSLTAPGSAIHLAGGSLSLSGTPVVGHSLYDNNLYPASGTVTIAPAGLGTGALLHVGGTAAQDGAVANFLGTPALGQAQAFRHVGSALLVGSQSGSNVVWALPAHYGTYGWAENAGTLAFTCDADRDSLLYLTVGGKLLRPTEDYTVQGDSDSTTITFTTSWLAANAAPQPGGYKVLASFANGYGRGSSTPVELLVDGVSSSHTTIAVAIDAVAANKTAVITLHDDLTITNKAGDRPVTIADGKQITLRSVADAAEPFTVLRGVSGDLFTLSDSGTSLAVTQLAIDGNKQNTAYASDGGGSLVFVSGNTSLALGSGASLQNNVHGSGSGGAVRVTGGSLSLLAGSSISGNAAAQTGGGVHLANCSQMAMAGGSISGNNATNGGGIWMDASGLALDAEGNAVPSITGNTVPSGNAGSGIFATTLSTIHITAGHIGTSSADNGLSIQNAADTSSKPTTSPIVLCKDFVPALASVWVQGWANGTTHADYTENDLAAGFAADFADSMDDPTAATAKRAAANRLSHNASAAFMRGAVDTDGTTIIWVDATGVKLEVGGVTSQYGDIADAMLDIPEGATATITLLKNITMRGLVVIDEERAVTLTSSNPSVPFTATRSAGLTGNLFIVSGSGSSLRITGAVLDGAAGDISQAGGSLVYVDGGSLELSTGATLQNNKNSSNTSKINGSGVHLASGSFTLAGGSITGNQTAGNGAGVYLAGGTAVISGGSISGNQIIAASGGLGSGVYNHGASLTISGGHIGTSSNDNGLVQRLAEADGLPATASLLIDSAVTTSTTRVNLEGWVSTTTGAKVYADNAKAALFDPDATLSYQQRLDAVACFVDTSNGAQPLHTILDPKAEGLLLRRDIADTRPLYTEAADSTLGSNVSWELDSTAPTPTGVVLTLRGQAKPLASPADYALGAGTGGGALITLTRTLLDSLENGTYTLTLQKGSGETLAVTGFTVAGTATVTLSVDGGTPAGYRSLAGAVYDAPAGKAATITLLQDITVSPITIDGGRQITLQSPSDSAVKTITRGGTGDLLTVNGSGSPKASLMLTNVVIDGGKGVGPSYADGGGSLLVLQNGAAATLANGATLQNNLYNGGNGGGVRVQGGSLTVLAVTSGTQATISGCQATNGGGIYAAGAGSTVQLGGANHAGTAAITGNVATTGGGIYTTTDAALAANANTGAINVQSNQANSGGGICLNGGTSHSLDGVTLTQNIATSGTGGGLLLQGNPTLTFANGSITDNAASGSGGGVYMDSGNLNCTNTLLADNSTSANGGGIASTGGSLNLSGSTLAENTAASGNGGGLYISGSDASATITGGTIGGAAAGSANTALNGGGIYLGSGAALTTRNAANGDQMNVIGNALQGASGNGAGIYTDDNTTLTLLGGNIGAAPAPGGISLDNGLWFHTDAPPLFGSGFGSLTGNVNLEGMHNGGSSIPFGSDDAVAGFASGFDSSNYQSLVDVANTIWYEDGGELYNAVAVPAAGGGFVVRTVENLYDCYILHRAVASDPPVYWRLVGSPAAVEEVYVEGQLLPDANYEVTSGSIRIELMEAYLNTLPDNRYTLQVYLTNDSPNMPSYELEFVVERYRGNQGGNGDGNGTGNGSGSGGSGSPQTGDPGDFGLWVLFAVSGAIGLAGCGLYWRKREYPEEAI